MRKGWVGVDLSKQCFALGLCEGLAVCKVPVTDGGFLLSPPTMSYLEARSGAVASVQMQQA